MINDLTQVWYKNPDTSMAYELVDENGNLIGYGGEIHENAVHLPDEAAVAEAEAELAAVQAAALAAAEAEAAAIAAAQETEAVASAEAAASAAAKLVDLGLTEDEAFAIIGYDPQVGEPLAPEE